MTAHLPAEAKQLIPHRGLMKLIDRLELYEPDDGRAVAVVKSDNLFLDRDGALDETVLVELLAQTAAAHSGYKALKSEGDAMAGFLVGVKDFRLYGRAKLNDELQLIIHRDFQMEQVTFLSGRVACRGQELASGVLKLWEMEQEKITVPGSLSGNTKREAAVLNWDSSQQEIMHQAELNQELLRYCQTYNPNIGQADFVFDTNFKGFDGHFPDNPIVPGVLLLKTGHLLASLQQKKQLSLMAVKTAKFARTVLPGETIRFSWEIAGDRLKTVARSGDNLCAKFSFQLAK